MSLLKEIQSDSIDAKVDISVVLRKCKVLAVRLGNNEFKLWVDRELNGYDSNDDVPEYRILRRVSSYGNFVGYGAKLKDAPIPSSVVPEEWREYITTVYFMSAVSYYNSLIKTKIDNGEPFGENWPADLIQFVSSKIIVNMSCIKAWKLIPAGSVASLLDAVRNRILTFVLEIEKEAPDAGEAAQNTQPIPNEKVTQVFHTVVYGNITNLSAGNQTTQITVFENDIASLKQYLKSLGIEDQELIELEKAIHEDSEKENKGIGNRVGTWIGKMISKASNSTWNITIATAANLLARAILLRLTLSDRV